MTDKKNIIIFSESENSASTRFPFPTAAARGSFLTEKVST